MLCFCRHYAGPKGAQLKVEVSSGIAAVHSNNPQGESRYTVDLCMQVLQPLPYCQIENMMTSHRVKARKWRDKQKE